MVLLRVVDITKRFGDIVALDHVTLDIFENEIFGVLGENGSGKSTLVKIIYGIYTPDSGYIELNDRHIYFSSPRDAIENGIVMISQRPQLIEELSVLDNIALFMNTPRFLVRNMAKMVMKQLGIDIELETLVSFLSYTEKQFVELIKALSIKPRLLIVDEATTYLPKEVRNKFYEVLKMFTSLGGSVIFITHKINEAVEICDRISVLRKGKLVGLYKRGDIDVETLRKIMFNENSRDITLVNNMLNSSAKKFSTIETTRNILDIENLTVLDDYGRRATDNITFSIRSGEIFSIVGIAGNGQKELCEGIIGFRKIVEGRIIFDGIDITRFPVAQRVSMGLNYLPEDPFRDGVVIDLTVGENLKLASSKKIDNEFMFRIVNELKVYPVNLNMKVFKFSGGNVQKISISRLQLFSPKCVIAYNPTRMLDEFSSRLVKSMFVDMSRKGVSILLVTEDIDEAIELSDRIAVISRGKLVKNFAAGFSNLREEIEKVMVVHG